MKMATSSERSPPPFPDSEDQEPDPEELRDQDSDDGEDIFLDPDNLLETKMASPSASDVPTKTREPPSDLFSESLIETASTAKHQRDHTEEAARDISVGSTNDVIDVSSVIAKSLKVDMEAVSDNAEAKSDIISKPLIDTDNEPGTDLLKKTHNTSSVPVMDIFSEPPSESISAPVMDVFGEPQSKTSNSPVMDVFMEPGDTLSKPNSSNLEPSSSSLVDVLSETSNINIKEPPKPDVIIDPLADLISSAPVHEIKAPVVAVTKVPTKDLFDDEPSNLFTEPRSSKSAKHLQSSFLDEPDEDLFSEPLGDTLKKPQNEAFKEELPPVAKPRNVRGPLNDNHSVDRTDIFTVEAVTTAPIAVNTVTVNAKANGVQSDEEEPDIFAEATVELSLDSPRNDRKRKEAAKPPASDPPPAVAVSTSKPQPPTLEELEEEEEEESGDRFELNISITNPEKVGDGMNAYMAYKVSTQTTLPMFRCKTFTVRRRFSDFLGLYEKLLDKHAQNGYIVPPPPEKSIMGMTKVKVGKEDNSSAEFVEKRRASLERYLQRVVCHPSLLQDPDVREFLERDEIPRAHSTQALSGAGFLKMINRATDAVSKMTIKMNESDVWFEDKLLEVEAEEQQLRKLHMMVESLVGHRKELSVNTAGFAKSVAMLGSSEDNTALSRALSQLAEVEDKMEQLHQEQAASDSFCFAELLADYIRLLGSVRASFDQRMKTWQRWQDAQNMLQKKREVEAKLLWANKPDKLQQAKDDITEWEAKVTEYERDFDKVSTTVRKEVLRFEKEKARDFKKQIIKYLESLLQSQQQLIKYWEAFLPEAKAIA
ncbi:hypothetical protein UPYG_G00259400 [Umbra pygmaea]|uniref:Sorting nexin-1 n=1 Tax=Umbra pygmaea TaxID=75934 RepID=A0ABD0W8U8_UMBPY